MACSITGLPASAMAVLELFKSHTNGGMDRCQRRTILSMPRGPRLVRTASATALAACMLLMRTSFLRAFSLCNSRREA